jgi:hypothetical protein
VDQNERGHHDTLNSGDELQPVAARVEGELNVARRRIFESWQRVAEHAHHEDEGGRAA